MSNLRELSMRAKGSATECYPDKLSNREYWLRTELWQLGEDLENLENHMIERTTVLDTRYYDELLADRSRLAEIEAENAELREQLETCQEDHDVWREGWKRATRRLAAHLENEGDECPLCACEDKLAQARRDYLRLEAYTRYLMFTIGLEEMRRYVPEYEPQEEHTTYDQLPDWQRRRLR